MSYHKDPTADRALGSVDREWKRLVKQAIFLQEARREYVGIYSRLLRMSVPELKALLPKERKES